MGGAIGAGVYFATHASTSTSYVSNSIYPPLFHLQKILLLLLLLPPSSSLTLPHSGGKWGDKRMLYCRVTLGSVGAGQSGIRRPPEKRGGGIHDSVGQVRFFSFLLLFSSLSLFSLFPLICLFSPFFLSSHRLSTNR